MTHLGMPHHIELRTGDLEGAVGAWGWLLEQLGYRVDREWARGRSWRLGPTYIVLEAAPQMGTHDRRSPGLSHLAFHAGTRHDVDRLWVGATRHGWRHLYADRHPRAGGPDHYAAFLENDERFKTELVATPIAR